MRRIYLIGSLRNPNIPAVGNALRAAGHEVFDDWFAAGPRADECWQKYETERGHTLIEALSGKSAGNVFRFDSEWFEWSDTAVLVLPAGRSGHLELGYLIGRGRQGFVLLDGAAPKRWDVMYKFATDVCPNLGKLVETLS